jgi:tetratricopeptide (TPR) repeat protein
MPQVEKSVFISYRRQNFPWALAVFQSLREHGFDVFFDYLSLASGDFEQNILENIRSRAHYLVLLAPSSLERCANPTDLFRREIEQAVVSRRNIVPLMLESFSFDSSNASKYLTGQLEKLRYYNGLTVPAEYFDAAMLKLRERYLDVALDAVLHPQSPRSQHSTEVQQAAAIRAEAVTREELTSQEWFERAGSVNDPIKRLHFLNEAIRLNPGFAEAYSNRAVLSGERGDIEGALLDSERAVYLQPKNPEVLYNRGLARCHIGNYADAVQDLNAAISLKPDFAEAYGCRGYARGLSGDLAGAVIDFEIAIEAIPDRAWNYLWRGIVHAMNGNLHEAHQDFDTAINKEPDLPGAYSRRGHVRCQEGELVNALEDVEQGVRLAPNLADSYLHRCVVRKAAGYLVGARSDIDKAIELQPRSAEAYFLRGLIRAEMEDFGDALVDLDEAILLKPTLGGVLEIRDAIHAELEARRLRADA